MKQLHYGDIIATFNWDCLLENAMVAANKVYGYNFENEQIQISKMHGSVNWRAGMDLDCKQNLKWIPTGLAEGNIPAELYFSPELLSFQPWRKAASLSGEVEPFLVLPGFGKAVDIRAVATLWYKPETIFAFTKDIYIIGLALNHDDFFVRSLLLSNLPYLSGFHDLERKIIIINPDLSVSNNYSFLQKCKGVQFSQERFNESHISQMEHDQLP